MVELEGKLERQLFSYLRRLSYRRANGTITADDAHRFLGRRGVRRDAGVRLSYINRIFNPYNGDLIKVGTRLSNREPAKRRLISSWFVA